MQNRQPEAKINMLGDGGLGMVVVPRIMGVEIILVGVEESGVIGVIRVIEVTEG